MNLALLNPFRQADRIDSTLTIPRALHPPRPKPTPTAKTSTTDVTATKFDKEKEEKSDAKKAVCSPPADIDIDALATILAKKSTEDNDKKDKEKSMHKLVEQPQQSQSEEMATILEDKEKKNKEEVSMVDPIKTTNKASKENKDTATTKPESMDVEMKESTTDAIAEEKKMASKTKVAKEKKDVPAAIATTPTNTTQQKKRRRKKKVTGGTKDNHSSSESDNSEDEDDENWTSCYAVQFNRRGSLLASGHASGLVPVHDFLGRTLSALYWPPPGIKLRKGAKNGCALLTSFMFQSDLSSDSGGKNNNSTKKRNLDKGKKKAGGSRKKPQLPKKKKKEDGETSTATTTTVPSITASDSGDQLMVDAAAIGEGIKSSSAAVASAAVVDTNSEPEKEEEEASDSQLQYMNGVTSLSWDRRSRTLLAAAIGDKNIRLMDNTHPLVATDCSDAVRKQYLAEGGGKDVIRDKESLSFGEKQASIIEQCPMIQLPSPEGKIPVYLQTVSLGRARLLESNIVDGCSESSGPFLEPKLAVHLETKVDKAKVMTFPARRHSTLLLELPQPLGGPVQMHPKDSHSGLLCMIDGSLSLFLMPPIAFYEALEQDLYLPKANINVDDEWKTAATSLLEAEDSKLGNLAYIVPPSAQYFITCAAFGKHGDVVWCCSKCGYLLAFSVDESMMDMLRGKCHKQSLTDISFANPEIKPKLRVKIPGGATAWQILTNGKHLLINSADCSLRLYDVEELSQEFDKASSDDTEDIKPCFVFQDNISKAPWASCDFSGDGEYVVGGCNSYPQPGDNYKLFLFSTHTGELVDQLTGPVTSLYSLSCHPTRPFIAVGTSDGIIDVWGARLDWVAFAPDFQALTQNELYEEREDEFDIVDGKEESLNRQRVPEDDDVDVATIQKVPALSDSEDEESTFHFAWKADKFLSGKVGGGGSPRKSDFE